MRIIYDEESDVLDVVFKENCRASTKAGYELRDGVVLYVTQDTSPIQLTFVNFRRLCELPVIHFDLLEKQRPEVRQRLYSLVGLAPISSFIRIDPATHYGHIKSPALLDVCYG